MLLLHALLFANTLAAPAPEPVKAEARVSVRIVRGTSIRWSDTAAAPPAAQVTRAQVRLDDGRRQPARLIEFE